MGQSEGSLFSVDLKGVVHDDLDGIQILVGFHFPKINYRAKF